MNRSKSQKFADTVFPHVSQAAASDLAVKYRTLSKKAGSLVRNAGLMQTLAFFQARAKGEPQHRMFYENLEQELVSLRIMPRNNPGLIEYVRNCPVPEYMYLTREVLHLVNWHKRLAETLITKEDDSND